MKILLTAAGFQGGYTLVNYLEEKGFEVVGTDMNSHSTARHYCKTFYTTPSGRSKNYIKRIIQIVKREKPDIILPASSYEVHALSDNKRRLENLGTKVLVSEPPVIAVSLNKLITYQKLQDVVDLPEYIYSDDGFIAKPLEGKGGRGISEIKEKFIMEKLEGEEVDVDVISYKGELLSAEVKTREFTYGGTIMGGEIVKRPKIVEEVRKIVKTIKLDYISVIQFIGGKLIEINPRIAGAFPDLEFPVLAIDLALGNISKEYIKKYKVPYGERLSRYVHQV